MELNEQQLTILKKNELHILSEFVEFCKENKLKYVMAYGSLLGTLRHGGFIPWDDDIDVMMPREDYDKFVSLFATKGKDDLFLQTYLSDPNFPYNYAKIRLNNTVFLEKSISDLSMHHGIFLDVFPVETVAKSKNSKITSLRCVLYYYCLNNQLFTYKNTNTKEKILLTLSKIILKVKSKRKIHISYDRMMKKCKDGKYCSDLSADFYITFPKRFIEEIEYATFENLEVAIPKKYDELLKLLYGNWRELPPVEERNPSHEIKIFEALDNFD